MKIKTSELTGPALDWAVAKCEHQGAADAYLHMWLSGGDKRFILDITNAPSTNWAQGGPIIEREMICIDRLMRGDWVAIPRNDAGDHLTYSEAVGPTPLIAAMRCYVSSKLGDEVEIPDELTS